MRQTNPNRTRACRALSWSAALSILWAIASATAPVTLAAFEAPAAPVQPATALGSGGAGSGGSTSRDFNTVIPVLPTVLTVEVPTGSVIGSDVAIGVLLKTKSGIALSEHVAMTLDGAALRSDKTDTTGKVSMIIPARSLTEARAYAVTVTFAGARGLAPASATGTLTILSAGIQILTVPPLPDLRFTLGDETATTGPDGIAALPVPKAGTYELTSDLNPSSSSAATVKASFVRWLDNVYTANRTVTITGPATFAMGLRVAYRASVQYVDLDNKPVDPKLVQQAQFSAGTGADDIVLNSQVGVGQVWWTASSAIRYSNQLQSTSVIYRALSVKIHGAEVVNRGQQSWEPKENGVWTIQLLLYAMTVQTSDALFGSPVSGTLTLTYPDGTEIKQEVNHDGRVFFSSLPRGQYKLSLSPVAISAPTPVALSRVQESTLRVVTYRDVGVVFGVLLLIGIVIVGRWVILSRRIKHRRERERALRAASM